MTRPIGSSTDAVAARLRASTFIKKKTRKVEFGDEHVLCFRREYLPSNRLACLGLGLQVALFIAAPSCRLAVCCCAFKLAVDTNSTWSFVATAKSVCDTRILTPRPAICDSMMVSGCTRGDPVSAGSCWLQGCTCLQLIFIAFAAYATVQTAKEPDSNMIFKYMHKSPGGRKEDNLMRVLPGGEKKQL